MIGNFTGSIYPSSEFMKMRVVISILVISTYCSLLHIDSSLEVPVFELSPEVQDIIFKSIFSPQFSGLEIALNILSIDLVDGQLA